MRLGMLVLVNQSIKIYFRINKLNLCTPLIRAIDHTANSAIKVTFKLAQLVTYSYFRGRLALLNSEYENADEYLSYAFKNCHNEFSRNLRCILIQLVPLKMLLGYIPKRTILAKHDLLQFDELGCALKEGNIAKFDKVIKQHEFFFIECGIYLIVLKLKNIVYRNLFKRVSCVGLFL